jgi:hypothetical protein
MVDEKKQKPRKLVLSKETVRKLTEDELQEVAGGNRPQTLHGSECGILCH